MASMVSLALNDQRALPAIGLGLYKVDPDQTVATVRSAVEIGYRLLDGAAFYGNETELGEAIRAVAGDYGVEREDLVIASKFWVTRCSPTTRRCATSTRR